MRALRTLMFVSVFAVPALARAEGAGATGSHPVAAVPHASAMATEPAAPSALASEFPRDTAPSPRERWYGWQSLCIDGASLITLLAASAASDSKSDASAVLAYSAVAGYLLGGPTIHFIHENPGRALGSLVLRTAVPIGFGYIGAALEHCSPDADLCGLGGAVLGGALGIATAVVVDAAALGYEEMSPEPDTGLQNVGVALGPEQAVLVASGIF
jgi:hypothetical protein